MRLLVATTAHLQQLARDCEHDVFLEAFGNTAEQLAEEYGPYEQQSVFIGVYDPDCTIAMGAARLIVPGPAGLKTLNDAATGPWQVTPATLAAAGVDEVRFFDVATLGVRAEHRRALGVFPALAWAIAQFAAVNDYTGAVALMDSGIVRALQMMGAGFDPLPGCTPAFYLGSEASIPCMQTYQEVLARALADHPLAYQLLTTGEGLPGLNLPDPDTLRLAPPALAA